MESYRAPRGFTLVELLVVLGIIGVVTGIVFMNQGAFNNSLMLVNSAYDVALTLRSAQSYGIGSRAAGSAANVGYGLRFDSSRSNAFTFYADTYPTPDSGNCHGLRMTNAPDAQPGDCVYTSGQDQNVSTYTLGSGITVSDFCAYPTVGNKWSCVSQGRGNGHSYGNRISNLDIVFARPNATPFMSVDGSYDSARPITQACIVLSAAQGGQERFISVGESGQIIANAAACP